MFTEDYEGVYIRHHPKKSLEEAVSLSIKLTSENPARLLGLFLNEENTQYFMKESFKWEKYEREKGKIELGFVSDCLLADIQGTPGKYQSCIEKVFIGKPDE